MRTPLLHASLAVAATGLLLLNFPDHAHAQSSLGIGTSEAAIPSTGLFAHWLYWINAQQQAFYRLLTGALKAMRTDGSKLWVLVGLSFVYGIFHAAGPGHGKAVISSYMLANEVALRRGIMLSFVSAMLQAATAITLMAAVFLVLRGTAISMTDASWALEIISYAAIACFGAWLLWKKLSPYVPPVRSAGVIAVAHAGHGHSHAHQVHAHRQDARLEHGHDRHNHDNGHAHDRHVHIHGPGEVCETCGHSHAPDPSMLGGDRFDWKTAWSAVAAVGIRPCSGALIVLTFAFLNGLWLGGILSVLAMGVGTAITVATLAILAVTAKNWAVAIAGGGRVSNGIHAAFEIGGAALVMLLGLTLLAASLAA